MSEKVIGYILIVVGILTMLLTALSVYQVFTKKAKPVELFNFKPISVDAGQILAGSLPPEADQFVNQDAPSFKQELVPADILNETSNIFAHIFLMGFIMSLGQKLASLGIQLVRPIVVKLKAKEVTSP